MMGEVRNEVIIAAHMVHANCMRHTKTRHVTRNTCHHLVLGALIDMQMITEMLYR